MKRDEQRSDVFGVWIKLKMPKQREEEEKDAMERVCCVCEKAFRSGKALGGHMRSHVMEKRRSEDPVFDIAEKKKKKLMAGGGGEKCSCVICGKKFQSMKSLFGHMRCHPDRDWRGINPPPNFTSSSSSSSSFDDGERAVDLTESLRGWPVTAKRGRKGKAAAEDDRLRDAVNFLMTLAEAEAEAEAEVNQMGGKGVVGVEGESVDELKVLKKKRRRKKKVKLCDLNLIMENDNNNNKKKQLQLHNVLHHTNLLDFDLNEVPPTDHPQFLPANYYACV